MGFEGKPDDIKKSILEGNKEHLKRAQKKSVESRKINDDIEKEHHEEKLRDMEEVARLRLDDLEEGHPWSDEDRDR